MSPFNIGDFLKRFRHLVPADRAVREAFIAATRECVGVELSERDVAVRGSVVYLIADPRVRSEVLMHRGEIVRRVNERARPGEKHVTEVR